MKKALMLLLAVPCIAHADASLVAACNAALQFIQGGSTTDKIGAANCIGLVRGATETHQVLKHFNPDMEAIYCEPENVTFDQRIRIVAKWLEGNPGELHNPSTTLVLLAMRNSFPCKK